MAERKTVCVDVDGTLAEYDTFQGVGDIGDPLPGAVEFTRDLSRIADVMIYSTRASAYENHGYNEQELVSNLKAWLDRHGFSYAAIYAGRGKPRASAYIDDRAVSCRPQSSALAYEHALLQTEKLCRD